MAESSPLYRRWLFALASLLVLSTFAMMALGGAVTSHNAGMAVPGGFTTAGSWSLITPVNDWWHAFDTRLEHAHRLLGYVVGLAAIAFVIGVWLPSTAQRGWVKVLAVVVLLFVVAQGVLGAYRVNHNSLLLAGIHGVTGQIYLGLTVLAAAAVGRRWTRRDPAQGRGPFVARVLTLGLLAALLLQLTLGSAVRHSHSALAIPDWPLHYGQVMPPMDDQALADVVAAYPADKLPERYGYLSEGGVYQPWQIHLHFTHRVMGYAVFLAGLGVSAFMLARYGGRNLGPVLVPALLLGLLMFTQVMLGIATVASGEDANFATLHQTCGAALLATAVWLAVRVRITPAGAAA